MNFIADLHIHSKYSRAVSQQMVIPEIANWAARKGIDLVGTGDFTHPLWLRELKANLEEIGEGIFKTKDLVFAPSSGRGEPRTKDINFLLTTEISSIYSQGGKLRRIHNLIIAPNFEVVDRINSELVKRGANLMSDGRPIIGLSARDLAALVLSVDKNCLIIPAHIFTPWFSLFGSMSGFDSISECFGDIAQYIYGIETGLSSSPEMNWRIKELDNRTILSFSDAHSGIKLGREVTVFKYQISNLRPETSASSVEPLRSRDIKYQKDNREYAFNYSDIVSAIKKEPDSNLKIAHTIEFYPEEGKYHFTGHRNCKIRQSPEETKKLGTTCPVCGKPLTIGVMHRVEQLSKYQISRLRQGYGGQANIKYQKDDKGVKWISDNQRPSYIMLVPLVEIIAEAENSSVTSIKVSNTYTSLINNFGSEFKVLLKTAIEEIRKIAGERMAEGIKKARAGEIVVEPGYDGEFGVVKIWGEGKEGREGKEGVNQQKQMSLF